jgi:hypothetical protein
LTQPVLEEVAVLGLPVVLVAVLVSLQLVVVALLPRASNR